MIIRQRQWKERKKWFVETLSVAMSAYIKQQKSNFESLNVVNSSIIQIQNHINTLPSLDLRSHARFKNGKVWKRKNFITHHAIDFIHFGIAPRFSIQLLYHFANVLFKVMKRTSNFRPPQCPGLRVTRSYVPIWTFEELEYAMGVIRQFLRVALLAKRKLNALETERKKKLRC